jgi:uncharacterized membrane protein SpoIIM required for sporulation
MAKEESNAANTEQLRDQMIDKFADQLSRHESRWNETEIILNRLDRTYGEKRSDDILRLGQLYIELVSDLNKLNQTPESSAARQRVNKLALKAYGAIYQPKSLGLLDMLAFFIFGFPKIVREKLPYIFAAMLIFIFSSFIGYLCINEKSKLIDLVIPPAQQEHYRENIRRINPDSPHPGAYGARFGDASFIMTNNIKVSAQAFATGIFIGVGTIYILILNGLLLGGLASLYTSGGLASFFWSLILPHGGIELLCVFISGGAGLLIGHSILVPGKHSRKDSIIIEGGKAIRLMFGIVPMLVMAGLIEAYITPAYISETAKFIFSALAIFLTVTWLVLGSLYNPEDLKKVLYK